MLNNKNIEFLPVIGEGIEQYFDELAQLRIEVFREFPYLYEGSLEYEKQYLSRYSQCEQSLVVFVKADGKIVGATTCIPFEFEESDFKDAFLAAGLNVERSVYFGESMIRQDFRGQGIGHEFFRYREEHALKVCPDLEYTAFCAVNRPIDHPLRPNDYVDLGAFWSRMGYTKRDDIVAESAWQDIDKAEEDMKSLTFWIKKWR